MGLLQYYDADDKNDDYYYNNGNENDDGSSINWGFIMTDKLHFVLDYNSYSKLDNYSKQVFEAF